MSTPTGVVTSGSRLGAQGAVETSCDTIGLFIAGLLGEGPGGGQGWWRTQRYRGPSMIRAKARKPRSSAKISITSAGWMLASGYMFGNALSSRFRLLADFFGAPTAHRSFDFCGHVSSRRGFRSHLVGGKMIRSCGWPGYKDAFASGRLLRCRGEHVTWRNPALLQ